jgi:hypothetical protein
LGLVYAFLRYLVDREVVRLDLLKRKLRVKVPEGLPRAIDPKDIQQLATQGTYLWIRENCGYGYKRFLAESDKFLKLVCPPSWTSS